MTQFNDGVDTLQDEANKVLNKVIQGVNPVDAVQGMKQVRNEFGFMSTPKQVKVNRGIARGRYFSSIEEKPSIFKRLFGPTKKVPEQV